MTYDILIVNGRIVDGTGACEPFRADIGISAGWIAAVGDLGSSRASRKIDARGRIVAPGFIDVHVHAELAVLGGPDQFAGLRQGITTQLLGPDGFGWAPLQPAEARDMWAYTRFGYGDAVLEPGWPTVPDCLDAYRGRTPVNVCPQVPHGAVRYAVMGWDSRPATDDEIQQMGRLVEEWTDVGALALSAGLDYQPAAHAEMRELVALCRIVAERGGLYATHQRYHLLGRKAAWEETLEIGRRAGIPVHISHERADAEADEIIENAIAEGVDVTFESYLYPAGVTHMTMMLPMDVQAGSPSQVLDRLGDPAVRERCLPELAEWLGRLDQTVVYTGSGRYVGLPLRVAAAKAGKSPTEFAYDLILEEEGVQAYVFPWQVSPEEAVATIDRTARNPRMMVASDGVYNVPHPHPRSHGCFAQVLGRTVRERGVLSLQDAVHKMSGFPADRFGLKDRGRIAEGRAADLVVFDQQTVGARATFEAPTLTAVGIDWVLVNGEAAVQGGEPTGCLAGKVLRAG